MPYQGRIPAKYPDTNYKYTLEQGSASSPTLSFLNDSNNGLWSPALDNIAISTDGNQRLTVNSVGQLLVNHGTATNIAGFTPRLQLQGTSFDEATISLTNNAGNNTGSYLLLTKGRSGFSGGYGIIANGDNLGQIRFHGADGTKFVEAAYIGVTVNGVPGENNMPGRLYFSTNSGTSLVSEKMCILPSGNIGIGTTNPTTTLQVWGNGTFGNTTTRGRVSLLQTNGNSNAYIECSINNALVLDGHGGVLLQNAAGSTLTTVDSTSGIQFVTWNRPIYFDGYGGFGGDVIMRDVLNSAEIFHAYLGDGTAGTSRKVTFPNGNVGIGTTTPSDKLSVNGYITESTDSGTTYWNVVTQQDIGTAPNQVPLNQYLGTLAYQDSDFVTADKLSVTAIDVNKYVSEKSYQITFPPGTAHQKVQIYWPTGIRLQGGIEITVMSSFNWANASGMIRKCYGVQLQESGAKYIETTRVPYSLGGIPSWFTISNFEWDSVNSRWYVVIANLAGTTTGTAQNSGNTIGIHVKTYLGNSWSFGMAASQTNISEIYSTDTTVYAQCFHNYPNNLSVGTITPNPNSALTLLGSSVEGLTIRRFGSSFGSGLYTSAAAGTEAAPTALGAVTTGVWEGAGYDGTTYRSTAKIVLNSEGTVTSTSSPGNIVFQTTSSGSVSATEKMRISSSGYVGIGINPGWPLHIKNSNNPQILVDGDANSNASIALRPNGSAVYSSIYFYNSSGTTNSSITCASGTDLFIDTSLNGNIYYRANGTGNHVFMRNGGSNESLRINSSGNVGIGTTNPTQKLHVEDGSTYINKYGDNVSNSYGLYVNTTGHAPGSSGPHYGVRVRQLGDRYTLNYGVFSEIKDDIGFYGGSTVDGIATLRGVGVYGYSPCSQQAYQKSIGVYGKVDNVGWNYNSIYGVKGLAQPGTSGFDTNSSLQNSGYGGHFLAYGSGSSTGVYADAFISGTVGTTANYGPERARPLVLATNGTELFTVESNGNLKAGTHSGTVVTTSDASAYSIYISDAGNDTTGNGSSTYPYRSLAKAFAQVPKLILNNSVSIIISGTSYTMTTGAILYGCHGGSVRSNAYTKVYIYCANGASTPIAMSGYGVEFDDCSVPIEIFNSTWNISSSGGGFSINRCNLFTFSNSTTINSDSTSGWSAIISVINCNTFSASCALNVSSSSTAGLGGLIVVSGTINAGWYGNITKSGTKYGNTAISAVNNSYIAIGGCTINNFNTGLYLGVNHYAAETGSHALTNGTTFNTCTTGVIVHMGSTYRAYSQTFTNCTTNISNQASTGAHGYIGGQASRGLFGYATTQNDTYWLQVNSQIFATSSTIATSDGRYKEEVVTITDGIDTLKKLRPVEFKWKEHNVHNFDTQTKTVGFIAQEVQEALSDKPYVNSIVKSNEIILEDADIESVEIEPPTESVFDEDGNLVEPEKPGVYEEVITKPAVTEEFLGIAEGNMIAILTAALQEAIAKIEELQTRLDNAGL